MRFAANAVVMGLATASCVTPTVHQRSPLQIQAVRDAPWSARVGHNNSDARGEYRELGLASWYGDELRGARTANGERFDPDALTAAHRTLPMGSYLALMALDSGRQVIVRINDRGPFHGNRMLDMSFGAARALGMTGHGARSVYAQQVFPSAQVRDAVMAGRIVMPATGGPSLVELRRQAGWLAPTEPARVARGAGPFWLQVATFSGYDRARQMAARLGATIKADGGLFRVRLGPYENAGQVNAALAPLAASGYPDASIVR